MLGAGNFSRTDLPGRPKYSGNSMGLTTSRHYISTITVFQSPGSGTKGWLVAGPIKVRCALGRSGRKHLKREGDGATPAGRFGLGGLWWRQDRRPRPRSGLRARPITGKDGWCEDPRSSCYNRAVRLPHPAAHETMRREDDLYDYVVEIAYNMGPTRRGRGSAIFWHLVRPGFQPTAGCVAVESGAMKKLLALIGQRTTIRIV